MYLLICWKTIQSKWKSYWGSFICLGA